MFILFTSSFGDDFYIAATVLIGIEVIGQFLKLADFSFLYTRFKEELVDDREMELQVETATNLVDKRFIAVVNG